MRVPRTIASVAATAAVAMAVTAVAAPTSATAQAKPAAEPTPYALSASAFGSTVNGGDLPISSGRTALAAIGCTNAAGKTNSNSVAGVDLPGLGSIDGIETVVSTNKNGQRVASTANNKIADVVLGAQGVGTLRISALTTSARVAKTQSGFTAEHGVSAVLKVTVGPVTTPVDLPTEGNPVTIPGLAKIALGPVVERQGANGAFAKVNGLVVTVIPTNTVVKLGQAQARIDTGVKSGVFKGNASGEKVTVANDLIKLGAQPNTTIPCQGTGGDTRTRSVAGVSLPPALELGALQTRVEGDNGDASASGFTEGSVASLDLGDGALEITGITGRANVSRTGRKIVANANGTTVGEILVDGEPASIPTGGELEIPGLAKLENGPVVKSGASISVSALKLTLLDGTGATILLGNAKLAILASGNN